MSSSKGGAAKNRAAGEKGGAAATGGTLGIVNALAGLLPGSIITEAALARIIGKHPVSIKRAVQRGELPPSVHFCGEPAWTVDSLVRHLEARLEKAREETETKDREGTGRHGGNLL
jgi:hypothetical protein